MSTRNAMRSVTCLDQIMDTDGELPFVFTMPVRFSNAMSSPNIDYVSFMCLCSIPIKLMAGSRHRGGCLAPVEANA